MCGINMCCVCPATDYGRISRGEDDSTPKHSRSTATKPITLFISCEQAFGGVSLPGGAVWETPAYLLSDNGTDFVDLEVN